MIYSEFRTYILSDLLRFGRRGMFVFLLFPCLLVQAQLVDDFSDGDFTNTPAWTGNAENFIVASGQLQLTDVAPVLTQSYLSTENGMADLNDKEWRLRVSQTFSGSDANQSRIYLTSDAQTFFYSGNNTASLQGYFLKLGEGLSGDVIRFYKDDGTSISLLASGTTNISTSFDIRIKVTRDSNGLWTIYADPTAGENYAVETSFTETTYSNSAYFGIICSYTSSNADNFFFDDIYAGDIVLDTTPPDLVSATATSVTTLDILFSEPVEETTSETNGNYTIPVLGSPASAARDGSILALVHLTYASAFTPNQTYTITSNLVQDLAGNVMTSSQSADFSWFVIAPAEFHDIVFNEILADPTPTVSLPEAEFVELFNTNTTETFNLENWKFVNTSTEKILPSFIMGPGEYVILCDQNNVDLFTPFGNVIGISSFSALSNTGDSLTLLTDQNMIIDVVNYSDAWYNSDVKRDGGWTLELINPGLPCQTASNWRESQNPAGGTPDEINSVYDLTPDTDLPTVQSITVLSDHSIFVQFSESMDTTFFSNPSWSIEPFNSAIAGTWNSSLDGVTLTTQSAITPPNTYTLQVSGIQDCSGNTITSANILFTIGFVPQTGEVIINEIMADPDPQIGMPDAEYIEIRNNTNTLLDISQLKLNDGFFDHQVLIQPSGFIVIADAGNEASFSSIPNSAFMEGFPGLTNSGLSVELTNTDGTVLDAVSYNITWYQDLSKIDGGWALERINPDVICSGKYNWKASVAANGGTAGEENSVYSIAPNGSPTVVNYGVLNESSIYIRFSESMDVNSTSAMDFNLSAGNSVSTPIWNSDKDLLIFSLTNPFIVEQIYTLNISGLTDCDGNQANPTVLNFLLGLEPQAGDIIINEMMADGTDGNQIASPKVDFIEIFNKTSHYIELTHTRVNDGFYDQQIILYPDSFIIVTDFDNDRIGFFAFPNTAFMHDFPALTESGMEVTLSSDLGVIDRVVYDKSFYHDASKESGGYSMELVNPNDPCSSSDNWSACTNTSGTSAGKRNSVFSLTPDTTVPALLYILAEPEESVTLIFNEPIGTASFNDLLFLVDGELQENTNPYLSGDESNQVVLYFGEMQNGVIYSFELTGLQDCWGNVAATITGQFAKPETPQIGDLIINEILYNPYTDGDDFIEIYNKSTKAISLKDWKISDATNDIMNNPDVITDINILLFPNEYLVLTKDGRNLSAFYPGTITNRIWGVPTMADFSSDDHAFLIMPDDAISDAFKYDDSFHYPLLNTTDGVSLERISFNRSSSDNTNWHSASEFVHFATPGYKNSQNEQDLVAESSLQVDPEIFSPDNDGYNDVVTFSYKLDTPGYTGSLKIYDSEGRLVKNLMRGELLGSQGSISWDGFNEDKIKASIGIYVIYFEAFNTEGNVVKSKKSCVLGHALH